MPAIADPVKTVQNEHKIGTMGTEPYSVSLKSNFKPSMSE